MPVHNPLYLLFFTPSRSGYRTPRRCSSFMGTAEHPTRQSRQPLPLRARQHPLGAAGPAAPSPPRHPPPRGTPPSAATPSQPAPAPNTAPPPAPRTDAPPRPPRGTHRSGRRRMPGAPPGRRGPWAAEAASFPPGRQRRRPPAAGHVRRPPARGAAGSALYVRGCGCHPPPAGRPAARTPLPLRPAAPARDALPRRSSPCRHRAARGRCAAPRAIPRSRGRAAPPPPQAWSPPPRRRQPRSRGVRGGRRSRAFLRRGRRRRRRVGRGRGRAHAGGRH